MNSLDIRVKGINGKLYRVSLKVHVIPLSSIRMVIGETKINCVQKLTGSYSTIFHYVNPVARRKTKIAYNFGLSECNRVKGLGGL